MVRPIVISRDLPAGSDAPPELRQRDPDNRLLARQSRRPPRRRVRPRQRPGGRAACSTARSAGRSVQALPAGRLLPAPQLPEARVRGRHRRRPVPPRPLHPLAAHLPAPDADAFDAPSREECTAERPRVRTPRCRRSTLLNDPDLRRGGPRPRRAGRSAESDGRCRPIATRLRARPRPPARPPRSAALLRESAHRPASSSASAATPRRRDDLLAVGAAPRADRDLDPAELAAWTTVARALLNLHETIDELLTPMIDLALDPIAAAPS